MDELKFKEKSSKNKNAKEPDWFITVTVVQIIMCIIVCAAVFLVSRSNGDSAQKLRNDFNNLMSITIDKSDVEDVFARFKDKFIKNENELSEETNLDESFESESAESKEVTETSAYVADKTTKAKEKTEETKALDETKAVMASGGEDLKLYSAKENTTFSPVATTCPIVRPVDGGWYSSYFGYRINPITNEKSFHTGLDIAVAQGSKIHAAYSGQVRLVGEDDHSGKYILLSHSDGFETFYCHCSEILADEGANIRSGETIALVGSTGWSTGPHLHFEVRKNGERLDPLGIIENDS